MPVKIVVLDGYTLAPNPQQAGEVNWEALKSLGDVQVYDRTDDADIVKRAANSEIVLVNKTPMRKDVLAQLSELKYVGVLATGVNVVDLEPARQQDVTVTNVPGYSTASVAQHVFALLLELTNQVAAHAQSVAAGDWARCPDFSYTLTPLTELAGKTMGIVGMGSIGKQVARIASALGMKIAAAHQRSMNQVSLHGIPIEWLPVDELLPKADVVSLHCPLTPQTQHMISSDRLSKMKKTAFLINTGRGPLVDEAALAKALHDGAIAGAGLDVLSSEPPAADNPLTTAPRCVITPHNAWASVEARQRLMQIATDNVKAFLAGNPTNVVN